MPKSDINVDSVGEYVTRKEYGEVLESILKLIKSVKDVNDEVNKLTKYINQQITCLLKR